MLSYQHIYHAGNFADVHKHALLAWMLTYLLRKDKPVTYIETHAGRGLYDLRSPEALKTGKAARGIERAMGFFGADHPYAKLLARLRSDFGPHTYPGSPMIAAHLLRAEDRLHLAELHPAEHDALSYVMSAFPAKCYRRDGFELAHSLCPPEPRRGLMLIDPSFELEKDYHDIPKHIQKITKAWNVGILCLWYPILKDRRHEGMLAQLGGHHADALRHEVQFPAAKDGHGMVGSGLFVVNPPYGLRDEAQRLGKHFKSAI